MWQKMETNVTSMNSCKEDRDRVALKTLSCMQIELEKMMVMVMPVFCGYSRVVISWKRS